MQRPSLPRLSRRRPGGGKPQADPAAATAEQPAATPQAPAAEGRPPGGDSPAATAALDPHERIDGLRAWLAQVDRRLSLRTYIEIALAVIALAAAGVAIYLYVMLEDDAATQSDVAALEDRLDEVEASATAAAEKSVESLGERLGAIEKDLAAISNDQQATERELDVIRDDIADLRSQISGLGGSGTSGSGASGGSFGGTDTKP